MGELQPHARELRRMIPDVYEGFGALHDEALADGALDTKTKELIAGHRDQLAVRRLLRHAKPETTARCTLVDDPSLIAAVRAAAVLGAVPLRLVDPGGTPRERHPGSGS